MIIVQIYQALGLAGTIYECLFEVRYTIFTFEILVLSGTIIKVKLQQKYDQYLPSREQVLILIESQPTNKVDDL